MARYRHNKHNRCSYCYELGHNARTCPEKTRHLKERAEAEVANGEGKEGYWHKQYARRTGQWADGSSAIEMKRTKSNARRCKYCNKTGHNTRTCPELAEAKATYMRELVACRSRVFDEISRIGLGVGALVTVEHYGEPVLYMVESLAWNAVDHERIRHNGGNPIRLRRLTTKLGSSWNQEMHVGFPRFENMNDAQDRWENYLVVGPVPVPDPGEAALTGADVNIKEVFSDRQSPNHWDNRWE